MQCDGGRGLTQGVYIKLWKGNREKEGGDETQRDLNSGVVWTVLVDLSLKRVAKKRLRGAGPKPWAMYPDTEEGRVHLGSGSEHSGLRLNVPEFPVRISVHVEAGGELGAQFPVREEIGRKVYEHAEAHSRNEKGNCPQRRPQWHRCSAL